MQILSHRRFLALASSILLGILFFSCAGGPKAAPGETPPETAPLPEETPSEGPPPPEFPPEKTHPEKAPPEKAPPAALPPQKSPPEKAPAEDIPIIGKGVTGRTDLSAFLLNNNPGADPLFTEELAALYLEESAVEGINHDIAFVQMCLETGFLRYGGLVKPEMNNFCGLGSINPDNPGESFPTPQIGVRAHIQHLKAYASEDGLNLKLVDPRYQWVRYGSAPTVEKLTGKWAADQEYGSKIRSILERLRRFTKSK
jgi:hypothetical protein